MIKLENVNKFYVNNNVTSLGLINVNLELDKNEIVVITGESGSGKSTLLNVITKVDKFDEGEIYYYGEETSYFGIEEMDQFRKNKVGFIFQNYNILESYTVLDNVMLPLLINGVPKKEAREKAKELIQKVGLSERIRSRGSKLSGGEKQRCVIARALAMSSEILACDEPTGNLDSETAKEIVELIKEIAKDKLVLIVTHNYELFKDIATRKIKIHDGEIVEDIKFSEGLKEENKDIELDDNKTKNSVNLRISAKSLKNTPIRTLLTSTIFFTICTLFLIVASWIFNTFNNTQTINNFVYVPDNKAIVYKDYNEKFSQSEIDKIPGTKLYNQFYYETTINGYGYEENPQDFKLSGGIMPTKDDDCVLLVSNDFEVPPTIILNGQELNVTGYQYRDDINNYPIISKCKYARIIFNARAILRSFYSIDFTQKTALSSEITVKDDITIGNYKLIDVSTLPKIESWQLYTVGYDFEDLINENIYEVTSYGDKNLIKISANINGFKYMDLKTYSILDPLMTFAMKLGSYVIIFSASLYLIGIYYLTYAIVGKLYDSKIKDFTILRTLGINKKDMGSILRFDIMFQMLLLESVIFIAFCILGKNVKAFANVFTFDIGIMFIYFILMTLISFLLSRKIHKRIYQNTINQVLGGTKND